MSEHKYFTIGNVSSIANPNDGLAIIAGDAPTKNADGSRNFSLRAPFLLISEIIDDRQNMAEIVAEILNENAHRLFASAMPPINVEEGEHGEHNEMPEKAS